MKLRSMTLSKAIEIILILTILMGIVASSFANVFDKKVVHNTGKISPYIVAASGYWRDIQDAVDRAAAMGGGNVYIPEGVWNFVNPGESWTGARVIIPAGVNVFGAPTEKYPNGSVVEWETVLVMPWDVPGSSGGEPAWFKIEGNGDPDKPTRFSDIKLVGYRDFDPNSTTLHRALVIQGVINFRVDHCYFRHTCEGVLIQESSGVIDHCIFDNVYGWHGGTDWGSRTIGYGVNVIRKNHETRWPNITDILGKYLNYTVFIEDCVFTKWRHCVCGNFGAHFVFRHNVVKGGFGYGEIDLHPMWTKPYVPCRAAEVYDNQFLNPEGRDAIHIWAGGGCFFNNTLQGYALFIYASGTSWNEDYYPHDIFIWNNTLGEATLIDGHVVQNEDYFLYKPEWYTPYPYPHPLTYS